MARKKDYVLVNGKEVDSCPFWTATSSKEAKHLSGSCRITKQSCRFGLTELTTPKGCPLIDGVSVMRGTRPLADT